MGASETGNGAARPLFQFGLTFSPNSSTPGKEVFGFFAQDGFAADTGRNPSVDASP